MQTYKENVNRFRILRHEELPVEHKKCLIEAGIDPDDNWALIWSFTNLESAEQCLENCNEDKAEWQTYKLVDAGEATVIERPIY